MDHNGKSVDNGMYLLLLIYIKVNDTDVKIMLAILMWLELSIPGWGPGRANLLVLVGGKEDRTEETKYGQIYLICWTKVLNVDRNFLKQAKQGCLELEGKYKNIKCKTKVLCSPYHLPYILL